MIQLSSVSKWFHSPQRVLDQISLEIKGGDFLYVLGGSGAGKTSLLRVLSTEDIPSDGDVNYFGYPLSKISASTLKTIRQAIGYVPQHSRLIPDLTVSENLMMSLTLSGKRNGAGSSSAEARRRSDDLLERLSLIQLRARRASQLSGGEAQRVAIARALIRQPQILIADEPTGAQDRDHTWSIMDLLLKANLTGTSVVIATHDREIVRRVRKRCAQMTEGRLMLEDSLCIY